MRDYQVTEERQSGISPTSHREDGRAPKSSLNSYGFSAQPSKYESINPKNQIAVNSILKYAMASNCQTMSIARNQNKRTSGQHDETRLVPLPASGSSMMGAVQSLSAMNQSMTRVKR
jgi:hypothetical protein